MLIPALIILLVAVVAFIVYRLINGSAPSLPSSNTSVSKPLPPATEDDEPTKVRVSGPRIVRTMGGHSVGEEMSIANGLTIGRGQGCTVRLQDEEMSSKHAEFRVDAGQAVVTDLDSTNGTYVNGRKLTANAPAPLKNMDLIKLGLTQLVYKDVD